MLLVFNIQNLQPISASNVSVNREGNVYISYSKKLRPPYAHTSQPSGLRHWKPPGFCTQPPTSYGLYTDFITLNLLFNVRYIIETYYFSDLFVIFMCKPITNVQLQTSGQRILMQSGKLRFGNELEPAFMTTKM